MGKSWLYNRYTIGSAILLVILILAFSMGLVMLDGENPLSMGMTIWHLQDSGREMLRVANEQERYLLVRHADWQERLAQNLNNIEGTSGGAMTVWKLDQDDGNKLTFYQEDNQEVREEVLYEYYLDKFVLITYLRQ